MEIVALHLFEHPLGPMGPSGQWLHFSPVTPSLQLQRPLLSHVALTEPGVQNFNIRNESGAFC